MDNFNKHQQEEDYGRPNPIFVNLAFRFLFPKNRDSALRKEFTEYVNSRYSKIGCVVIWARGNCPFASQIGEKEVVITPKSILATYNLHVEPKGI